MDDPEGECRKRKATLDRLQKQGLIMPGSSNALYIVERDGEVVIREVIKITLPVVRPT